MVRRVAQRLAHLLAGRGDPGVVHPGGGEVVAGRPRLGLLVLVVGEAQVVAAAVDVERAAEVLPRHRRALDVPPRTPRAPRRGPRRGLGLGVLAALPQGEVAGVALAARVGVGRGLHLGDALPRELAVRRPRHHVEVDVAGAVTRRVGVAALDQPLDERQHLRDVPGGQRLVGRRQHVEGVVRRRQRARHVVGEVEPGPALLGGLHQDLVVDVGDVADEGDLEPAVGQPAAQHVEVDRRADVADVRLPLHGEPADVDARPALLKGHERAHLAGHGVVEPDRHRSIVRRADAPLVPVTEVTEAVSMWG